MVFVTFDMPLASMVSTARNFCPCPLNYSFPAVSLSLRNQFHVDFQDVSFLNVLTTGQLSGETSPTSLLFSVLSEKTSASSGERSLL